MTITLAERLLDPDLPLALKDGLSDDMVDHAFTNEVTGHIVWNDDEATSWK